MQALVEYATDRSKHQPGMIKQVFEQIRLLDSENYPALAREHIQNCITEFRKKRPPKKIRLELDSIEGALQQEDLVTARFHLMRARNKLYSWSSAGKTFEPARGSQPCQEFMDKIEFHIDGIQSYHHGACLPAACIPEADHFNAELSLRYPSLLEPATDAFSTQNRKIATKLATSSASSGKKGVFTSSRSKRRKKASSSKSVGGWRLWQAAHLVI